MFIPPKLELIARDKTFEIEISAQNPEFQARTAEILFSGGARYLEKRGKGFVYLFHVPIICKDFYPPGETVAVYPQGGLFFGSVLSYPG